ncbi:hypothetical protein ACJJI5_15005 [Microbulbifer sp. EKSA008]|uniref:hypothetical protein n=1 Tax=Microbulbifer sp. EKSA008 TaxID=3243367 RepID=UPI004042DF94
MTNQKLPLSKLNECFQNKKINLVARSSFEARWALSLGELKNLESITILESDNISQEALETYSLIDEFFFEKSKKMKLSKSDPQKTYRQIKTSFENTFVFDSTYLNVVDISSFRREELFMALLLLKELFEANASFDCRLIYVEADNMDEDWLSRNTAEIRTVLGYSGDPMQSKKTCVISMVGHELNRVKDIIDVYDPSKLMIGRGMQSESINTVLSRRNEIFYRELSSYYGNQCSKFEFSLLDPVKVRDQLSELCKDDGYNYVIAPFNNKISCIGVSLFALENPGVQVCYSVMSEYNRSTYSTPGNHVHILDLNVFWKG